MVPKMKRRHVGWGVLGIAILGLILWLASGPSEPAYQGKPLSAWLAQLDDHRGDSVIEWSSELRLHLDEKQLQAAEAIRHLGTNALPRLMADLQTPDNSIQTLVRSVRLSLRQLVRWEPLPGQSSPARSARSPPVVHLRHRAALGLIALGPAAQTAVPQLTDLYTNSPFGSSKEAALVLASLGSEGLAPLHGAITNPIWGRPELEAEAVWALAQFPTNGQSIVRDLALAVTNTRRALFFRGTALRGLSQISTDAQSTVTALLPALNDPQEDIRRETLFILERYGAQATSAVPVLLQKLNTRDLHHQVLQTLRAIDRKANNPSQFFFLPPLDGKR
jgi:hypothetical protein